MFTGIEPEQTLPIAMKDGAGGQHFRVKPGTPRHQTVEDAAMPVGPIHHGGDAESSIHYFAAFADVLNHSSLKIEGLFATILACFGPSYQTGLL
jgi:hypothetical protein